MKDDYTTNSHYLAHTFLFRNVGRMYFLNLGVKGLICFYCPLLGSAHLIRGGGGGFIYRKLSQSS